MPPLTVDDITKRGYIESPEGTRYTVGSSEATNYLLNAPKTPVSMLSTENAQQTVDQKMGRLNGLSPSTAPGYQTPPADPNKPVIPKAYFTNENGQEAEYNQEQLNNEDTRKFLQSNGYVMTKTEGPSLQAGEVKGLDTQLEGLVKNITTYNVDEDPGFKLQKDSITQQFTELRQKMEQANTSRMAAFSTMGIRSGSSRYAGGVQMGIEGEELKQGAARIAEISRKEADAISAARNAYRTGKYTEFTTQVNGLEKLRTDKAKELTDFNKKLADTNKKLNDTLYRSSRDSAIAGLVSQGVTDPTTLLGYLNYDEQGNTVGDFTAKEVGDALKLLSPNGNMTGLPATVKEFYSLKGSGSLPSSITNLPEDEQFFQYLAMKKRAQTVPKSGGGSTGSKTNLITLSEAKSAGLPVSVVGSSEADIVASLKQDKPPAWFVEKLIAEQGNDNYAETIWNQYRTKINQPAPKKAAATGPVKLYTK